MFNQNRANPQRPPVDLCTQIKDWLKSLGIITRVLFVFNLIPYLLSNVLGLFLKMDFAMQPEFVWKYGQWYRLFTCSFMHNDGGHIFFNMLALLFLGRALERFYGSMAFVSLSFILVVFAGVIDLLLNTLLWYTVGDVSWLVEYDAFGLGYSAVLFGYMQVYFGGLLSSDTINLCGWKLKTRYITLIYLVFNKIMIPKSSLMGHLSGIVAGAMFDFGLLSFCLPGYTWVAQTEEEGCCSGIKNKFQSYYLATDNYKESAAFNIGIVAACKFVCGSCLSLCKKKGEEGSQSIGDPATYNANSRVYSESPYGIQLGRPAYSQFNDNAEDL